MTCKAGIIIHDTNIGTDGDPIIVPVAACNAARESEECGFEVRYAEHDGTPHTAHDWWVTSEDFRRYESLHARFSDTHSELAPDPQCPHCPHPRSSHDQLLAGAGKIMLPEYNPYSVDDLYECNFYTGMGNWCGCRHWSRQETVPEGPNGHEVPLP